MRAPRSSDRPAAERAAEENEPADTLGTAGLTRPAGQWRIGANRRARRCTVRCGIMRCDSPCVDVYLTQRSLPDQCVRNKLQM